jgi:predicted nuclease of predicted toxin-antitoxin system
LADAGHDVETAVAEGLSGRPDQDVFERCLQERRALVTLDLDFADIRRFPPADHDGIILLRPSTNSAEAIVPLARRVGALLDHEQVSGRLWVVDSVKVRIRS